VIRVDPLEPRIVMQDPPASVGMRLAEVATPALMVDLDRYEANLDRMTESLIGFNVQLRPHAKTHKCPTIALHQIERGAVGVCCQTLGEAEAMVAGGVRDVLITNQVVSSGKIQRLVNLARQAEVAVCVDNAQNVAALASAAAAAGVRLPLLVEVDIGQHRCGVAPGVPTVALAKLIAAQDALRFDGIHAYHGGAQHVYDERDRLHLMQRSIELVRETVTLLRLRGLAPKRVTGAGTGTYPIEADSGVYNEVQPGSYIFMDVDYDRVQGAPGLYENALFVLTTVLSVSDGRGVCDAGLKASSIDSGLPVVADNPAIRFVAASDEHGSLEWTRDASALKLGAVLRLIPGHCDPTVNLHDWFVAVRNDRVEAIWPITARGANA
jgi:3-hydroxy-D-aspartate aldolase